jgi:GAF domain-containing protein
MPAHDPGDQQWRAFFDLLLEEAVAAAGAERGTLQLMDDPTRSLRIVASRGFDLPFLEFFAAVRENDDSACARTLRERGRIIVPDITQSEIFSGTPSGDVLRTANVRAVQSTPLFDRYGRQIGALSTHWASVWRPSDDALSRLDALCFRAVREIASL